MTETTAPEAEVAVLAQEPSTPVTEVKETETPEGEGSPEKSEEQKKLDALERRIARQTAANRDTQRRYEEARQKIAEYEQKLAANPAPLAAEPQEDDFESIKEYAKAYSKWEKEQEQAAANKPAEPNVDELVDQKLKEKEVETSFRAKETEFRTANPDYDKATEVVNGLLQYVDPKHPSTQAFTSTLLNAENPPAIIHYLGTHPDVAIALMKMSPFEIQDQLGVIIDSLSVAPAQNEPPKPKQTLPTPPTPVGGTARVAKSPDQMSGKELLKRYDLK